MNHPFNVSCYCAFRQLPMIRIRYASFFCVLLAAISQSHSAVWKVTRDIAVASNGFTNSISFEARQMADLPDGILGRTVKRTADGVTTQTEISVDRQSGIETEVSTSDVAGSIVVKRLNGLEIENQSFKGTWRYAYDALGRVIQVFREDAAGAGFIPVCRMSYTERSDLAKLETCVSHAEVVSESYAYDVYGNKSAVTNALGHVAWSAYDPFGRITATGGATRPMRFEYDTRGCRTALYTTRNGTEWDGTFWKYNPHAAQVVEKKRADGSATAYSFTADGLPLRTVFPDGRWKEFSYNAQRKVASVAYSEGNAHSLQYDEFGMPVSVENSRNEIFSFSYGVNSTLTNELFCSPVVRSELRRSFDKFSRLVRLAHLVDNVEQSRVDFAYDAANQTKRISLTDSGGKSFDVVYATGFGYCNGYKISNGSRMIVERTLERDSFRRDLVTSCTSATPVFSSHFDFSYDSLGRLVSRNGDFFAYDSRGQTVSATIGGRHFAYQWDHAGNLVRSVDSDNAVRYVSNELNQYLAIVPENLAVSNVLEYAANGGLSFDGTWRYAYDEENRLVSVSPNVASNGSFRISFDYDFKNRRTASVCEMFDAASSQWNVLERRDWLYDGWNLVWENVVSYSSGVTNTLCRKYWWGCDISGSLDGGAGGIGGLLAVSCNGNFCFPLYDAMGNIVCYVDENGSEVARFSYSPFGDCIAENGGMSHMFPFRFSTKYFEPRFNAYFFGQRYYSPKLMRWFTPDPGEERGGGNLYAFCCNAPTCSFDPNGLIRVPLVTDAAKQLWEMIVREVLDRRGWSVAALLMRHSLKPAPGNLSFGENSIVSQKIKTSPEYRKIIDSLVANQRETNAYYDSYADIAYKTGDLFAAIGRARVYYRGTICKSGGRTFVDLDIVVKDDYDFHFLSSYWKMSLDGVLATIANNMAWSDQYFDVITPFSWSATFKESN